MNAGIYKFMKIFINSAIWHFSTWTNWVIVKPSAKWYHTTYNFSTWTNWVIVKQEKNPLATAEYFSTWTNWVIVKLASSTT